MSTEWNDLMKKNGHQLLGAYHSHFTHISSLNLHQPSEVDAASVLWLRIQKFRKIWYGTFTEATQMIGKPYEIAFMKFPPFKNHKWIYTMCEALS